MVLAVTPHTWKMFLAKSSPIVVMYELKGNLSTAPMPWEAMYSDNTSIWIIVLDNHPKITPNWDKVGLRIADIQEERRIQP